MAVVTTSLRWREKNVATSVKKSASASLLRELGGYLVEMPAAAIIALWIICLPLMYFALYGDLSKSVGILAEMTATFLAWLMGFMTVVVSACLIAAYIAHKRTKIRWRKIDSRR